MKKQLNAEQRNWLSKLNQDVTYCRQKLGTLELIIRVLENDWYDARDAHLLNVYVIPAYVTYLKEK